MTAHCTIICTQVWLQLSIQQITSRLGYITPQQTPRRGIGSRYKVVKINHTTPWIPLKWIVRANRFCICIWTTHLKEMQRMKKTCIRKITADASFFSWAERSSNQAASFESHSLVFALSLILDAFIFSCTNKSTLRWSKRHI